MPCCWLTLSQRHSLLLMLLIWKTMTPNQALCKLAVDPLSYLPNISLVLELFLENCLWWCFFCFWNILYLGLFARFFLWSCPCTSWLPCWLHCSYFGLFGRMLAWVMSTKHWLFHACLFFILHLSLGWCWLLLCCWCLYIHLCVPNKWWWWCYSSMVFNRKNHWWQHILSCCHHL